jgi:ATP-binding cassette subfamily B protein
MRNKAALFLRSVTLVWRSSPGYTATGVVVSAAASVLPLALVWLIKKLTEAVTATASSGPAADYTPALWAIVAIALIYFLDETTAAVGSLVRRIQNYRLGSYMHNLLHQKSLSLDLSHFEDPASWDILSRATREAPRRPASIINNLVALLRSSLSLLLIAGLILMLSKVLIVVLLVANIPGIWLRIYYSEKLYKFRREATPEERRTAYFNWILTGDRPSRELRLFNMGNRFRELFSQSWTNLNREEIEIVRRRTAIEIVSGLFKAAAAFFVISYLIRAVMAQTISLGDLAMYLVAFRLGMSYIWQVLGSVAGLYEDSLFVSDLFEYLDLKPQVKAPPVPQVVKPFSHALRAEDITFRYPGATEDLLKGVSLEIRKGETVALAGDNGAGKSTLVRLLTRLYDPQQGTITLDGTDIRSFDPAAYRRLFSVIFQDFMLYNLTAAENISLGDISSEGESHFRMAGSSRSHFSSEADTPHQSHHSRESHFTSGPHSATRSDKSTQRESTPQSHFSSEADTSQQSHPSHPSHLTSEADRERIIRAARTAGIHQLIESLPQGYETVLGRLFDDSRELSWGEWQKLALARALYRDAPLLVLDEPASAMDAAAEYELFHHFREITRNRTALLISHRFSNISLADRIVVLDNGKIIESGTHNELIKADGFYATRYMQQKSLYS